MGIGNRRRAIRTVLYRGTAEGEEAEYFDDVAAEIVAGRMEREKLRIGADKVWTSIDGKFVYNQWNAVIGSFLNGMSATRYVIEYEGEETPGDPDALFPTTTQFIKVLPDIKNPDFQQRVSGGNIFNREAWANSIQRLKEDILPPERFVGSTGGTIGDREIPGVEVFPTDRVDSFGRVYRRDVDAPIYIDSTFEYNTPYRYQEAAGMNFNDMVTLVGDVRPEYNFYSRQYENILSSADEKTYPCMYAFVSEKESDYTDDDNSVYNQHISLNGRIRGVFKDITNRRGERIGERDVGIIDYFNSWSDGFKKILDSENIDDARLFNKFQNMVFSQSDVDFLNTIAEQKESFPMTNEVRFSTGVGTQISDILKDSSLFSDLIAYALTAETDSIAHAERSQGVLSRQEYSVINLADWWASIGTPRVVDDAIVFGRNKTSEAGILNSDAATGPVGNLLKVIFLGKIRNLINEHSRTFKQAVDEGAICHSETLVYEIEKYKIDATGDSSLQRIFIPNSSDLELCRFIDTQLQYDTEYQYRIFVHQVVFGTKYSYYPEESDALQINTITGQFITDDSTARERGRESERVDVELPRFRVEIEPHLELVRAPYFTSDVVRILDKPPVAPDVNFIPYKGISNRVLMNLNAGTGDYHLMPKIIDRTDLRDIKIIRANQGVGPKEPINYVSDDPPQEFEIFRLRRKPVGYEDFSGNMLTTISTLKGLENLTAVSFVDGIIPNVKYYYTFRVRDVHFLLQYIK